MPLLILFNRLNIWKSIFKINPFPYFDDFIQHFIFRIRYLKWRWKYLRKYIFFHFSFLWLVFLFVLDCLNFKCLSKIVKINFTSRYIFKWHWIVYVYNHILAVWYIYNVLQCRTCALAVLIEMFVVTFYYGVFIKVPLSCFNSYFDCCHIAFTLFCLDGLLTFWLA